MLKDMGSNAYRTSHNMPEPELVEACNEMGMMVMAESFDEWKRAKVKNGYNRDFKAWIEKDIVNLVRRYRNDPSVVMWCMGNEVPDQGTSDGVKVNRMIQDIFHREDPTRPCTVGMDRVDLVVKNGFAHILDVPGFNYRSHLVQDAYKRLPQQVVLGSETASTVSSRGVYKFPVERRSMAMYDDHQSSSYDLEHCSWSDLPEDNFILYEDLPYGMGEFVWTGFDYLGEPTPYYTNWPSHSSLFGIIDLAGLPKDRYYLYRSHWNKADHTLHILPHWTWNGREDETTPVFVYSDYPTVELFINGVSQGKRTKDLSVKIDDTENDASRKSLARQKRYRHMWMDTKYEPGTLRAVAYDAQGEVCMETEVHTAGKPYAIELVPEENRSLKAGAEDLAYITVRIVDKNGILCPDAQHSVKFSVKGAGTYRAGANGDPTNLELFHLPKMKVFNGMMTAIVQEGGKAGKITLVASAKGLKSAKLEIEVE
jgi:beta-galactosidase